ncbi:MAG: carbon monoxide dehydrogenase subunit G [Thermoprotei archaeon]
MPELKGEEKISATQDRVWELLSDPLKVGECIPGAKNIQPVDQDTFKADVTVAVGFIKNNYKVTVSTVEKSPPEKARLRITGQGGGSNLSAEALVTLRPEGQSTILSYSSNVTIGGPLAGLGSRFVNGTAEKVLKELFACIKQKLETDGSQPKSN